MYIISRLYQNVIKIFIKSLADITLSQFKFTFQKLPEVVKKIVSEDDDLAEKLM